MNTNKIYFIQTLTEPGKRHVYVVSSPSIAEAIVEVQDNWCSDDEEIIHFERIREMVDTDETMSGKTYIKIHN